MRLFRVILPVADIDAAAAFYQELLGGQPGERVTAGRHYFDCEGTLLACWDAVRDGDPQFPGPNQGVVYLSTAEPLERVRERVVRAAAVPDPQRGAIAVQPWGERSFYFRDPWGNRVCVAATGTEYLGGSFTFP
jgi:catechol 2,3-dioxygenase-like lactoylglutathione lyase family enzyme